MSTAIYTSDPRQSTSKEPVLPIYGIKRISSLLLPDKTYESSKKGLISKTSDTAKMYCFLFKEKVRYGFRRNLWSKKSLGIMLVLIFTICNSMITAHYLSIFSFEQTNDMFSYLGFIILSFFGITIINARWIKIVAEKYAKKF